MFPLLTRDGMAAIELLGTPVYVYNFESEHIVWSNGAALQFWNAESVDELIGRTLTPYSESTKQRLANFLERFRNGEVVTESWTFYPRGIPTSTISRCSGIRLEGCNEAMMVEVQVLSETELPSPELRAIEALRHTTLLVSMFSETGKVLMRNPAAQACFGEIDKSEDPGADLFKAMFADPADAELLLNDALTSGKVAVRTAAMAIEGLPVHAMHLTLLTDPVSGDTARLVTQEDVSMLARVSRQLAASEASLDSVLSLSVGPAFVVSTQDSVILKANFAAQAIFGAVRALKSRMDECFADQADFVAFCSVILANGAGTVQIKMRAADGALFWAAVSGARIIYDKQEALVILVTDINQLYQMTADLEAALDIERQTTEMQRRFLAIAAHDLQTPLAIIDNTAQMLERSATTGPPDQIQMRAARIRATVRRMLRLIENTVVNTRRSLGALGYDPSRGSICEVVSATARVFKETHPGLQLSLDLPTIPLLSFDQHLIEQALTNLLSNAVKYSEGVPRVEISVIGRSDDVQIIVRDYGIGIPHQDREGVFGDYVRGANVGERPGSGLGLSIVRQIVSLHGGGIDIVETSGQGTTVRITLPR